MSVLVMTFCMNSYTLLAELIISLHGLFSTVLSKDLLPMTPCKLLLNKS